MVDNDAVNRDQAGTQEGGYREGDRVYQPGERLDPPKAPGVPDTERVEIEPIDPARVAE